MRHRTTSLGSCVVSMAHAHRPRVGRGAAWSSVFVKDVDKLHEELRAKKATIRMPPKDMPWKLREMHVEDEDGNVIRFGSAIKH